MTDPVKQLEAITQEMMAGNLPAPKVAEYRTVLAGLYSYFSGQQELILYNKPVTWAEMRLKHNSDKATDNEWDGTDSGRAETVYRLRLKRIEKLLSALKTQFDLLNNEARNNM